MLHFLCSDTKTDTVQYTVFVHVGSVCTREQIYDLLGSSRQRGRPGWKTVGVSGGWRGWKVVDPYCRWSVEEEENILLDHTRGLASQGQRKRSLRTQRVKKRSIFAYAHIGTHTQIFAYVGMNVNASYEYDIPLPAPPSPGTPPTDRCVCHLKVVWHSVNCIQTPASVWDYSSHSWLLGWAPEPILIPFNCESADLGTVGMEVPLTDSKMQ